MKTNLLTIAALALLLAACSAGGHFQLGSDNTGIGANAHARIGEQGLNVGAGTGAHVLGHGFHVGAGGNVE